MKTKHKKNITYLLFYVGLFLPSCIKVDIPPDTATFAVYGMLTPSDSKVSIFVSKYLKLNDTLNLGAGKYISNADVKIVRDSDTLSLVFNVKSQNYEAENKNFIQPLGTYNLIVQIPGKAKVTAQTIVPPLNQLHIDTLSTSQNTTSLKVSWPKGENNSIYKLVGTVSLDIPRLERFFWATNPVSWLTSDHAEVSKKIISPEGTFNFIPEANKAQVTLFLQTYNKETFDFKDKIEKLDQKTELFRLLEPPLILHSNLSNHTPGFFGSYTESKLNIIIEK